MNELGSQIPDKLKCVACTLSSLSSPSSLPLPQPLTPFLVSSIRQVFEEAAYAFKQKLASSWEIIWKRAALARQWQEGFKKLPEFFEGFVVSSIFKTLVGIFVFFFLNIF